MTLSRTIGALQTAAFFPECLRHLGGLSPFTGAFVTRFFRGRPPQHIFDNVRTERRRVVVDQYLDSAYLFDPFYDAYLGGRTDFVCRLRDIAPDHFQRSTYFRQYYGNVDLRDELGIVIGMPDDSAVFFSLGRTGADKRFPASAVKAVAAEMPVLAALTRKHFERHPSIDATETLRASADAAMARIGSEVLTAREMEIASLILKGHSSGSIARLTGTAVGTVKIHRKNLYRKLGISSQTELFAIFLDAVMG